MREPGTMSYDEWKDGEDRKRKPVSELNRSLDAAAEAICALAFGAAALLLIGRASIGLIDDEREAGRREGRAAIASWPLPKPGPSGTVRSPPTGDQAPVWKSEQALAICMLAVYVDDVQANVPREQITRDLEALCPGK